MKDHQVILGTRHDTTCAPEITAAIAAIFGRHGFAVHENVGGYTGGNIVATQGQPRARCVHAIQVEVNASLLMTTSGEEFIAQVKQGGDLPRRAAASIARYRKRLHEVLAALPPVLAAVHASWLAAGGAR